MNRFNFLFAPLTLVFPLAAYAYDPINHELISEAAFIRSSIADSQVIRRKLGIELTNTFPSTDPEPATRIKTIQELIKFGSRFEDTRQVPQALYHFFDPTDGKALTAYSPPKGGLLSTGINSPTWILEDRGNVADLIGNPNPYSYRRGRGYFLKALTETTKTERDRNWGLTFQTLGHVVHHLQDMAQPQHARNDAHCDILACALASFFGIGNAYGLAAYETYIVSDLGRSKIDYSGYAPVYSATNTSVVKTPRDLWHTNQAGGSATGKGIAEFSNVNFVTEGTNFIMRDGIARANPRYALPAPGLAKDESIDQVFGAEAIPQKLKELCAFDTKTCFVTFYQTEVNDRLTNTSTVNPRASTYSLFDSDLAEHGGNPKIIDPTTGVGYSTQRIFSLNRFNFDTMQKLLIPRAVGYSAGLINYFFRGDIEMSEDPDRTGTYVVVNKGNELLTGTFRLYYDDVSDNRVLLNTWTLSIPAGGKVNVGAIAPPAEPAPKKRDEYMLVFNGDMGDETRAMFETGGVTGAQVNLSPGNTLYLAGLDAANQLVLMKTDKSGTQVLPGNEFHPLRNMFSQSKTARAKTYLSKQSSFSNGGESYSVRSVVVGDAKFPIASTNYILFNDNPRQLFRDYREAFNQFTWQASYQAADGQRVLAFALLPSTETTGTLYFDTYLMGEGNPQSLGRTFVTIPPLPTGKTPIVSLLDVGRGKFLVSPDGKRLIGLIANGNATGERDHFELQLTIGEAVSATWVKTRTDTYFGSLSETPNTGTLLGVRKVVSPLVCPNEPAEEFEVKNIRYVETLDLENIISQTSYLDFQKDQLVQVNYQKRVVMKNRFEETIEAGNHTSRCVPAGEPNYYQIHNHAGTGMSTTETTEKWSAGSNAVELFDRQLRGGCGVETIKGNCKMDFQFEGRTFGSVPVHASTPDGLPAVAKTGKTLFRALNDKMDEAIVIEANNGQTVRLQVAGQTLSNSYVADASPLGEIFVANTDLSVVIHRPRASGIKSWEKPANVVKLLGVIWM